MKKIVLLILLLISFGLPGLSENVLPNVSLHFANQGQTVYVTKTGKKYHKDGCRYLSKSKIKTTKETAQSKGYSACSVCFR